jgi:alginate O-acetyltransferase complex protein AlgI
MDITSLKFLFLFLPVFLVLYLVSRNELRLLLITVANVVFLLWGQPSAILWLSIILITSYFIGLYLSSEKRTDKVVWLWVGISIDLLLLSFFKFYTAYGFPFISSPNIPNLWRPPLTGLIVPVGISFVTFQAISYLVDVHRKIIPAESNLLRLAAYLFFFPKLVSGPLMRYGPFADQIKEIHLTMENIAGGIRRLLIGFIKRTLIANQVAILADAVFNLPQPTIAPHFAWLALVAYALQIYFDFAGYTDMAIGLGMMIGVQLPENFNQPYLARSISDFWRRWHMTLTAWFREYVFYPLERRRFRWAGQQINILIVFFLTGLWHGFRPTFVIWGLIHGLALVMESLGFGRWLNRIWRPLQHVYVLALILAGWVFFRSDSVSFALLFFRRLAGDTSGLTPLPFSQTSPLPFIDPSMILTLAIGIIFLFPIGSLWERKKTDMQPANLVPQFLFQAVSDVLLIALFVLGLAASVSQQFYPNIYASF